MNSSTVNPNQAPLEGPAPEQGQHGFRRGSRRGCGSIGGFYIAAIVLGFIVFWPIGLALLAWAIWRDEIKALPFVQKIRNGDMPRAPRFTGMPGRRPSNSALAEYLSREQERLKAEQEKLDELVKAFEAFKDAERDAADRRDFESFLRQRGDSSADEGSAEQR